MHYIPPYETSVSLFHRDGEVWVYPSLAAAMRKLGYAWICKHVGKEFREFSHAEYAWRPLNGVSVPLDRIYIEHEFIMRDDAGKPVTGASFQHLREKRLGWWARRYRLLDKWDGEGPVPGVHRPRRGRYYRSLTTTQERRWATPVVEDGEPAPRPARNAHNLPNAWDDYRNSTRDDRSWKHFRKQQWRDR